MDEAETPRKKQKNVLGPIDDSPFDPPSSVPPLLQLRRQDTIPDMDSEVQVADSWSSNAKEYQDLATKVPIVSYFSEYAAQLLISNCTKALQPGCTFLDVCAGPGTYAFSVMDALGHNKAKELNFIITDFSAGMIEQAKEVASKRQPVPTNVTFDVEDVQNMSLPSMTSDVVGCMFGYFVPDRKKAWLELCRVSKPRKFAVIGTWKYAAFAYILDDFLKFLGRIEPYAAMSVAHSCSDKDKLEEEISRVGFGLVKIYEHGKVFDMPQTDDLIMALFHNPMIKNELMSYSPEYLLKEWRKFLVATVDKYHYDEATNILPIEYIANIVIAEK